ncbi:MAG: hypothetical protein KC475_10015 [Cyanobacteria bacterium HKST-UBA03]|nr:hypothetical protein [Cyanobacteria bacterium HKST-UBA03]
MSDTPLPIRRRFVACFQKQDCSQTLGQALETFYAVNADRFSRPTPTDDWTRLLAAHDVCHVLFGVNTSLVDETLGDFWTMLGTDVGIRQYLAYLNNPEAKALLAQAGWRALLQAMWFALPLIWQVWRRSRQMSQPWKLWDYEAHLATPLDELRRDHHLHIIPYVDAPPAFGA